MTNYLDIQAVQQKRTNAKYYVDPYFYKYQITFHNLLLAKICKRTVTYNLYNSQVELTTNELHKWMNALHVLIDKHNTMYTPAEQQMFKAVSKQLTKLYRLTNRNLKQLNTKASLKKDYIDTMIVWLAIFCLLAAMVVTILSGKYIINNIAQFIANTITDQMVNQKFVKWATIIYSIAVIIVLILGLTVMKSSQIRWAQSQNDNSKSKIATQRAKTHFKPQTLHQKVVIKTFMYNPYTTDNNNDNNASDDATNIGIQINRYLNSIQNLKDYNVNQQYHRGEFFGNDPSTTVTLTRK